MGHPARGRLSRALPDLCASDDLYQWSIEWIGEPAERECAGDQFTRLSGCRSWSDDRGTSTASSLGRHPRKPVRPFLQILILINASGRCLGFLFSSVPQNHGIDAVATVDAAPTPLPIFIQALGADEAVTTQADHLFLFLTGLELLAEIPDIFNRVEILAHITPHFLLGPIAIARFRLRLKDAAARQ